MAPATRGLGGEPPQGFSPAKPKANSSIHVVPRQLAPAARSRSTTGACVTSRGAELAQLGFPHPLLHPATAMLFLTAKLSPWSAWPRAPSRARRCTQILPASCGIASGSHRIQVDQQGKSDEPNTSKASKLTVPAAVSCGYPWYCAAWIRHDQPGGPSIGVCVAAAQTAEGGLFRVGCGRESAWCEVRLR